MGGGHGGGVEVLARLAAVLEVFAGARPVFEADDVTPDGYEVVRPAVALYGGGGRQLYAPLDPCGIGGYRLGVHSL